MATIIYRYAQFKGYDTRLYDKIAYTDKNSISPYSEDAILWATKNGILEGNEDKTFRLFTNTTRTEAAAVFNRVNIRSYTL